MSYDTATQDLLGYASVGALLDIIMDQNVVRGLGVDNSLKMSMTALMNCSSEDDHPKWGLNCKHIVYVLGMSSCLF